MFWEEVSYVLRGIIEALASGKSAGEIIGSILLALMGGFLIYALRAQNIGQRYKNDQQDLQINHAMGKLYNEWNEAKTETKCFNQINAPLETISSKLTDELSNSLNSIGHKKLLNRLLNLTVRSFTINKAVKVCSIQFNIGNNPSNFDKILFPKKKLTIKSLGRIGFATLSYRDGLLISHLTVFNRLDLCNDLIDYGNGMLKSIP